MSIIGSALDTTRPLSEDTLTYWNKFFQFWFFIVAFAWLFYTVCRGGFRSAVSTVTSAAVPA